MARDAAEDRKGEAAHVPPKERLGFKRLLAVNPNYSGNLEKTPFKPVIKMAGNTTYLDPTTALSLVPRVCVASWTTRVLAAERRQGRPRRRGSVDQEE